MKKNSVLKALLITVLIGAGWLYLDLTPLNIHSVSFWITLVILAGIFLSLSGMAGKLQTYKDANGQVHVMMPKKPGKSAGVILLAVLVVIGAILSGSPIFRASAYSRLLTVEDGTEADIPSSDSAETIALMDTASAAMLGDRKLGSLTDVVSQFEVAGYMQLNVNDKPVKTAPLSYAGLIKWIKNKDQGIPGYVMVDPVKMEARYVSVSEGMKYVPSAYFQQNLRRHIYFRYPTAMITNEHFEIDEEGNPWYVAPVYSYTIGLFGGKQIVSVILVNPITGDMEKYDADNVPSWVDVVYDGDLLCDHYNYYAQLQQGFINSVIGQSGCKKTTSVYSRDSDGDLVEQADFGYLAKDGDIWIYTGVTSVNGDSSNLGFIISNERTAETKFIPCAGADESSAMNAAMGEVQEKRYAASFPSLITVDGQPTYIMVLKDSSGLVKMYAAVNVEQYNLVATDTGLKECLRKYTSLVSGEPVPEEKDLSSYETKEITVVKKESLVQDGNTYLYIVDENGQIYSAKYAEVIQMMLVEEGDVITIQTDGTNFLYE